MNLRYGILPETYKLTLGAGNRFRVSMIDGYDKTISLCAARNDSAAFQIVLSADCRFTLNCGNAAFFAQRRRPTLRLSAESEFDIGFFAEGMLCDDDRFKKADIIKNDPVCELEDDRPVAVYAEISIGKNAKPGLYKIPLRFFLSDMFSDEKMIAETVITLEVFSYVMPDADKRPFYLDLWQHNCNIARKYGVEPWSDGHFAVLENYIESLSRLGQKTVTLVVSDTPWSGQWCHLEERVKANLYEYSIVKITKRTNGKYQYNFDAMQRYIDLCAKYRIDSELSVYGLANVWCDPLGGFEKLAPDHPDGLKLRYFDESDGCYKYMREGKDIDAYIKALYDYFAATGQLERVRVVADEPADTEAYRRITENIKRTAPGFRFKAAINHSEFIPEFKDTVSDFVPSLASLSAELDKINEYKASMPDSRFTWYICNEPEWPNTLLRSDLCETLFIGALTSYMKMDGFLRWDYTVWTNEPTEDIRYFGWPAGDICFVYPSKDARPMLSLRYKALNRAIGLCCLLDEYRNRFGEQQAKKLYRRVILEEDIKKYFDCKKIVQRDKLMSVNYGDYNDIRRKALAALSEEQ